MTDAEKFSTLLRSCEELLDVYEEHGPECCDEEICGIHNTIIAITNNCIPIKDSTTYNK